MPTGIQPLRTLWPAGGTWTYTAAIPQTQTTYLPFYRIRNTPTTTMTRFLNSYIFLTSAASRQRMAANGYLGVEICPDKFFDGTYFNALRQSSVYVNQFAYGSTAAAGTTGICGGTYQTRQYPGWFGALSHEYYWVEDQLFFPASAREPSHAAYNTISSWPEFIAFQNACNANGQSDTGPSLGNGMRCAQRARDHPFPTTAIPFNATGAQVSTAVNNIPIVIPGQASVWGGGLSGPLPGAVDIVFFGQYQQAPLPNMVVISNNLTGGTAPTPVIVTQRVGSGGFDPVQRITVTGSPTGGSFVLGFKQNIDDITAYVGAGTSGTTPTQRIAMWDNMCTTFNWFQ
jgi:hypothetical protein